MNANQAMMPSKIVLREVLTLLACMCVFSILGSGCSAASNDPEVPRESVSWDFSESRSIEIVGWPEDKRDRNTWSILDPFVVDLDLGSIEIDIPSDHVVLYQAGGDVVSANFMALEHQGFEVFLEVVIQPILAGMTDAMDAELEDVLESLNRWQGSNPDVNSDPFECRAENDLIHLHLTLDVRPSTEPTPSYRLRIRVNWK